MRFSWIRILLVIILTGNFLNCYADYKEEILKLSRIDLLPRFQENIISKQISSYDTTGGNDDGFSGKYSYLSEKNGEQVIADFKGPGIIHRIWTPTPTNDTICFYFDGETVPRISLKFIDLFTGEKYPFKRPVVGNEVGGYYCYLPIPFKESCKIVFQGKMQFIQIQYSEANHERVYESFPEQFSESEKKALAKTLRLWENYGENILNTSSGYSEDIKLITKDFTIKPGEVFPVLSLKKGGRILGIEIEAGVPLNDLIKDVILRANWDDEKVNAINCPLTDFFGYAFGKPSMKSLLVGVRDGIHYSYLPMPFNKRALLELEYIRDSLNTTSKIPFNIKVYYTEKKCMVNEGKLYVEWKREINPELGEPYRILKKTGRGHYIGTLLQAQGLNSGMTIFFEGDDECYIDGELRLHGTGSEDYFNGGWYALPDRWDQDYSLPLHGCLEYSIPLARTGGFRFLVTDKISFEKNLSLTIEHGPANNNIPVDYASVAFYYCDTAPQSNKLPASDLLRQIETPETLEYWPQLLSINALSRNALITHESFRDSLTDKNLDVYKLEVKNNGFTKFELEVPGSARYKLYITYLKGPDCGDFDIYQRQIPVRKEMEGYNPNYKLIEKEYVGDIKIEENTNTVTVMLHKNLENSESTNLFLLHRIYLEKITNRKG